ncbi:hypothetical protein HDR61_04170 [bacterium]|nr:hypothetical protein [bacterium]
MKYNEVTFFQIAPLIKSIKVKDGIVTIYANHDIDPKDSRNNSISLLKNLKTIRDALHNVIKCESPDNNCVLLFKYNKQTKYIIDQLIRTKNRHDALETLRNNGGISLSAYEKLLFNNSTRTSVIEVMQQKNK